MTPEKQVSPAIRILRGERDASARATHLEAATRKFLVTTNERKYMSTKTNFKRIALVAVAALGLGVLSSVPTNAAITTGSIIITTVDGTGSVSTVGNSDSRTAASLTVSALKGAVARDSVTVSVIVKSRPTGSTAVPHLLLKDTLTSTAATSARATSDSRTGQVRATADGTGVLAPNDTAVGSTGVVVVDSNYATTAAYTAATFLVYLESGSGILAGTYTFTAIVNAFDNGAENATKVTTKDFSIVVTAPAADSKVANSANSTAIMSQGASWVAGTLSDSTVAVSATASTDVAAVVRVILKNASGSTAAKESVTATISAGTIGNGSNKGRSVVLAYSSTSLDLEISPDGTSGTAVITISTPSVKFANKSVTFYGTGAKITAGSYSSVIGASGIGVWGTEFDSLGNDLAGGTDLYAFSSDTTVISSYGAACGAYDTTLKVVPCTLTGVKAGTANITLRDASTVAASTISSAAIPVRVSFGVATSYKVTTSAASYAPGQPGVILVSVLDADGKVMPAGTYSNLFTSTGISTNMTMGTAINGTLSSASVTTASNPVASATKPVVTTDPVMQYYYYMPTTGGTLTFSYKGGSSVPAAAQVSGTTSATITDNAAAALAAVTALATTVASLKTLITTLTNLVLKIQKKVKA